MLVTNSGAIFRTQALLKLFFKQGTVEAHDTIFLCGNYRHNMIGVGRRHASSLLICVGIVIITGNTRVTASKE